MQSVLLSHALVMCLGFAAWGTVVMWVTCVAVSPSSRTSDQVHTSWTSNFQFPPTEHSLQRCLTLSPSYRVKNPISEHKILPISHPEKRYPGKFHPLPKKLCINPVSYSVYCCFSPEPRQIPSCYFSPSQSLVWGLLFLSDLQVCLGSRLLNVFPSML